MSETKRALETRQESLNKSIGSLQKDIATQEKWMEDPRRRNDFSQGKLDRMREELARQTQERDTISGQLDNMKNVADDVSSMFGQALDATIEDVTGLSFINETSRFNKMSSIFDDIGSFVDEPSVDLSNFTVSGGFNWDKFNNRMNDIDAQVAFEHKQRRNLGKGVVSGPLIKDNPETDKKVEPVTQPQMPAGNVEAPTRENIENKLTSKIVQKPNIVNNTSNNLSGVDKTAPIKRDLPAVRPQETEFQNRIFSNTRVIWQ